MSGADWAGLLMVAGVLLACIVTAAWALDGLIGDDR